MVLAHFDPLTEVRRELDSLFNTTPIKPAAEIEETNEAYLIRLELPGMTSDDITIEASNNTLTVSAERRTERRNNSRSEFYYGSYRRQFSFATPVNKDSVEARYKNGILAMTIPKNERDGTVKIKVI